MKKLCCCIMVCLMLFSSFFTIPVFAAHEDFDVQSGVLIKYNGTDADVTVPAHITAIGNDAFAENTKVHSVKLNDTVRVIGDRAFYGCTSLQNVTQGDAVTEVGDLAFYGTPYLDNAGDKYVMLGSVLLWYNGTSESVTIPTRCTAVASYAFARCEYLKSFTAYEGLVSIGTGAFYGCTELASVNLPSTLSAVGAYAFDGTPYLNNLSDYAVAGDGVLLRYQGSDTEIEIPDTIKRIASHAFVSSKIKSVTLPESVYAIDAYAFADCTGLETVQTAEGLVTVGDGAFRGCKSLSRFKTPGSLSYIGQYAFNGDSAIDSAVLRGDHLTVSYHAFKGCTSMRYVLMTDGVAQLYDNAFDGCAELEGVSVSPKTTDISASALSGCAKAVVCCDQNSEAESALSDHSINTVMGDVDSSGELDVFDASTIQCYIAYLAQLDGTQTASADVNYDGDINIMDAYICQLKIVHLA
ncbi:leucine-rich repeat protein [Ruminococcus sp.]|uniref:leucine-rich repeat protein n=1 Tax=Ruminococcus sp. TaxID=41978 RepID=UPI0038673CCE